MRLGPPTPRPCVALAFSLLALGLLAALAACSRSGRQDDEFRIGLLLPVSGTPPLTKAKGAAEALVEDVNARGGLLVGGRRLTVRLLVEDTGGQVERAMSAAVRLIRQERVSALVGPFYSRDGLPVAGVAEKGRVPMVSPTASSPLLTKKRGFVFRICMVDTAQGPIMARFAREELGLKSAAVLSNESEDYSRGLAGLFSESFAALGGRVLARETYASGATRFAGQMERIRASGAQALFLPNFTKDVLRQMVQARAAGFRGVFLGCDSWSESEELFGLPEASGAFFSSNFNPGQALAGQRAREAELLKARGIPLDIETALTLDALGVVLAAAQAAGSADPVSLRAGLSSLRAYDGFSGRLSFRGGGDATRSAHVLVIAGGKASNRKDLEPGQ